MVSGTLPLAQVGDGSGSWWSGGGGRLLLCLTKYWQSRRCLLAAEVVVAELPVTAQLHLHLPFPGSFLFDMS